MANQGLAPSEQAALQQFENQRTHIAGAAEFLASQRLFWEERANRKRVAPHTPMQSGSGTPAGDHDAAPSGATGSDALGPSLVQPVTVQDEAAFAFTAADQGVDINVAANLQNWLTTPVQTNRDVLRLVRSYHKQVIRPEYYNIAIQLETALKHIDDKVFQTKRELAWMSADNRSQQKHMAGLQLITTGWPAGVRPEQRLYLIGWMLQQIPAVTTFLQVRGLLQDHNSTTQYLNVLSTEPTTVPQGTFFSTMTVLSFKAWDMGQAFIQKYGGGSGTPLYLAEDQPMRGHHVKVVPNSPQWQRKTESPLRVILAAMNSADHNPDNKKFIILWKSLTIMEPMEQNADFKEDARAWARIHYQNKDGEFEGRMEIVPELSRILFSGPENVDAKEETLWEEKWGQVQWGPQRELDEADKAAFGAALQESKGSGKGVSYKGKRHWSAPMVHSSYYAPFPFELNIVEYKVRCYAAAGRRPCCMHIPRKARASGARRGDGQRRDHNAGRAHNGCSSGPQRQGQRQKLLMGSLVPREIGLPRPTTPTLERVEELCVSSLGFLGKCPASRTTALAVGSLSSFSLFFFGSRRAGSTETTTPKQGSRQGSTTG